MFSLLQLMNDYEEMWKLTDPRVEGWLLMSSMKPLLCFIVLSFAAFHFGPRLMKTRKALQIDDKIACFNVVLFVLNAYNSCQLLIGGYRKKYNWFCQLPDATATDHEEMRVVNSMHLVLMVKLLEFVDVFFLVARKKAGEDNVIVVFHHSYVALVCWAAARWYPSGSAFLPAMLTSVFHAVLYAYFSLLVIAPSFAKAPPMKNAFACFLMLQFVTLMTYFVMTIWTSCRHAFLLSVATFAFLLFMIAFYACKFLSKCRNKSVADVIKMTNSFGSNSLY